MLILSNCLSQTPDEGCLNVANSLIKRIKALQPEVTVVSYGDDPAQGDVHLRLNKFLLSRKLRKLLRKKKEPVLYLPFPARSVATAMRIFCLSVLSPRPVAALLTMTEPVGLVGKLLLKFSGANVLALSREAADRYEAVLGKKRVQYLKTGVDTKKFVPVSEQEQKELKISYGLDPEKRVILHAGHLKQGRNIAQLMKFDDAWQVVLVTSTLTAQEADMQLREQLLARKNIRIIDTYLPEIQQVYQLCDCYFFPVTEPGNCIDVPLSVLEAAACGKPVLSTDYGEMRSLLCKDGFYPIESFEEAALNQRMAQIVQTSADPREAVLEYDWNCAVSEIMKLWE